jgi:polysaccharide biosynthesis/export protein
MNTTPPIRAVACAALALLFWPPASVVVADEAAPIRDAAVTISAARDGYRVQPGDILTVSVWKEPELQSEILVRPDGGISFPLAGDISARDMTIAGLADALTERLRKYIP